MVRVIRDLVGVGSRPDTGVVEGEVLPPAAAPTQGMVGGAHDGASRYSRELASWNPIRGSADADVLPEKPTIDARARDVVRNDAVVAAAVESRKDSIVGDAYVLSAKPNNLVLGMDEAWSEEFQLEVESKFELWAESTRCWPDASRRKTFTDMVRLAVGTEMVGGEVLATAEWFEGDGPFATAIQMIDADRLSMPLDRVVNSYVRGGVQLDRHGRRKGYYIRSYHPGDYRSNFYQGNIWGLRVADMATWRYIPATKPWGRQQVIHIAEQQRPEQTRGISTMVSALKELKITKTFRDVVLQNAVINATYAATIESELDSEAIFAALGGATPSEENLAVAIENYASGFMNVITKYSENANNLKLDGARIPHLLPGTKLQLRPAGQGGPLGTEFEQSLLRYIACSLGISYEQLSKDYSKTNYSSARAAMAETWKFMQTRKSVVADRFATMVYMLWLEEAIAEGELECMKGRRVPSFWDGINAEAYTRCQWIGAGRGQIDELKETQAAVLKIKFGLTTREAELARQGLDWRKVFEQLEREQREADRRGIVFAEEAEMMNAASGTPREKEGASNAASE